MSNLNRGYQDFFAGRNDTTGGEEYYKGWITAYREHYNKFWDSRYKW